MVCKLGKRVNAVMWYKEASAIAHLVYESVMVLKQCCPITASVPARGHSGTVIGILRTNLPSSEILRECESRNLNTQSPRARLSGEENGEMGGEGEGEGSPREGMEP